MNRRDRFRQRDEKEAVDPKPHELYSQSAALSLKEQIQQYVRTAVSQAAERAGLGSFEEEDDFSDPGDEPDLVSPHELRAMAPEGPPESLDGPAGPSPEAKAETPGEAPPA